MSIPNCYFAEHGYRKRFWIYYHTNCALLTVHSFKIPTKNRTNKDFHRKLSAYIRVRGLYFKTVPAQNSDWVPLTYFKPNKPYPNSVELNFPCRVLIAKDLNKKWRYMNLLVIFYLLVCRNELSPDIASIAISLQPHEHERDSTLKLLQWRLVREIEILVNLSSYHNHKPNISPLFLKDVKWKRQMIMPQIW